MPNKVHESARTRFPVKSPKEMYTSIGFTLLIRTMASSDLFSFQLKAIATANAILLKYVYGNQNLY